MRILVTGTAGFIGAALAQRLLVRGDVVHGYDNSIAPYRVHDLGDDQPVQLLRFIELLEQNFRRTVEKRLLPMQPGDVPDTGPTCRHCAATWATRRIPRPMMAWRVSSSGTAATTTGSKRLGDHQEDHAQQQQYRQLVEPSQRARGR